MTFALVALYVIGTYATHAFFGLMEEAETLAGKRVGRRDFPAAKVLWPLFWVAMAIVHMAMWIEEKAEESA